MSTLGWHRGGHGLPRDLADAGRPGCQDAFRGYLGKAVAWFACDAAELAAQVHATRRPQLDHVHTRVGAGIPRLGVPPASADGRNAAAFLHVGFLEPRRDSHSGGRGGFAWHVPSVSTASRAGSGTTIRRHREKRPRTHAASVRPPAPAPRVSPR